VNAEIKEALTAFRRFHSAIEGKIAIYGSLVFFSITMLQSAVSAAMEPNQKLPGALEYKISGLMKIPCEKHRPYPYGYRVLVSLNDVPVEWATVCRDFTNGGWFWDFSR
jgi:hypothetical protein